MLWVDKHRPTSLEKLSYHVPMAERLARLATAADLPHLLFYGPNGAGKKTRIMAVLRKVFGVGVEKMKLEHRTFKTPSNRSIEVTTVASSHHIEINPADAGIYDRFVVQEVIKEIAENGSLDRSMKVVLLSEVDALTKEAQHALRRTMEKCSKTCRLILCCESPSCVIDPVRSRCLGIRVPAPNPAEIMSVLEGIAKKESIVLEKPFAARIANNSNGNLRRAILMLEACRVQSYPFSMGQQLQIPDWEQFAHLVATDILREQSPQQLLAVRAKLYRLLVNCIPAVTVLKTVLAKLLMVLAPSIKVELIKVAADYEHRMLFGQKAVFHLEAYVAKTMALLARHSMEARG